MTDVKFSGPCVFCGQMIDESQVDPCSVTVETHNGLFQVWYCHARCFKERVAENPFLDLSPAHF